MRWSASRCCSGWPAAWAAQLAEPRPGIDLDPAVLGIGFAAVLAGGRAHQGGHGHRRHRHPDGVRARARPHRGAGAQRAARGRTARRDPARRDRWPEAWTLFANATGIDSQATVNVPLVLFAIPATLLLANVIAAWPGWTAARLRPAQALRTE